MLEDYIDDFVLMVQAGFVAVYQGDAISATKLFEAAMVLKPEHSAPKLGMCHIALHRLKLDEATRILNEVLAAEKDNYTARTMLGLCYILRKQNQAEGVALIQDAMSKTDDFGVQDLGAAALEWMAQQEKKAKMPII